MWKGLCLGAIFLLKSFVFSSLCVVLFASVAVAEKEYQNSVLVYGAKYTPNRLVEIAVNDHSMEESYLVALAWNREFARSYSFLGWETEAQVVKHFKGQHNMEFNALVVARWHEFPWNHRIKTTLAVGDGLSLASRKPKLEQERKPKASALLNYLLFELTLAPPQSRWYWSARIHHRSGIFGLFNGVDGGSNFIGSGVGYRF